MENLKKLDNIEKQIEQIRKELNELEQSEVLKRYFELSKKNNKLLIEQKKIIAEIKNHEYECCDHILVITSIDRDEYEGRSQKYYGCVKCGLNEQIYRKCAYSRNLLSFEEKIMYDFLKNGYLNGKRLNFLCDLNSSNSLYNKIKQNNPDIDEATLCKYFEIELENIRNEEVKNKRKENKVKRLSLNS